MSGKVFVFNVCGESLMLAVNGAEAASISGWSQGYQPVSAAVPRAPGPGQVAGSFVNGSNDLALRWPSGGHSAKIQIDGAMFPPYQDLLIFVTRNQWQLVNGVGVLVTTGFVGWGGD